MKYEKTRTILKFLLLLIAAAWILHTFSKNFVVDPNFKKFLAEKTDFTSDAAWFWVLRIHIVLALIALLMGPIGFFERLRRRSIRAHRYVGRIYVISILLNFFPSVYLAFFATGGAPSVIGFLFLDLFWAGATYLAYRAIRNKQVNRHRQWMIRSVALTMANLQLYVLKTVLSRAAGLDYEIAYTIAVWTCWLGGLLIAEIIIRKYFPSAVRQPIAETVKIASGERTVASSGSFQSLNKKVDVENNAL